MFTAKTDRINKSLKDDPKLLNKLQTVFNEKTNIYIDFSNVYYWQAKLGWHVDLKRLMQLFKSFDTINEIKLYQGELMSNTKSITFAGEIRSYGYMLQTKPVKEMDLSIDVTGISLESPEIVKNYVNKSLLGKLDIDTVKFLNQKLLELNQRGMKSIHHLKCNFDVEMGIDIYLDTYKDSSVRTIVLWTGDSDFDYVINQLKKQGKRVVVFGTARRISKEIERSGVQIFDIKKLKKLICWKKELVAL